MTDGGKKEKESGGEKSRRRSMDWAASFFY